jgi:hypothetical protein
MVMRDRYLAAAAQRNAGLDIASGQGLARTAAVFALATDQDADHQRQCAF